MPTYNEQKNIQVLIEELKQICADKPFSLEVIIVDDNSPDGTGAFADRLAQRFNLSKKFSIKVIHREGKLGLGSAVTTGFSNASGQIIGVMDADLSHPPQIIPQLIEPIVQKKAQLTVGSRLVKGGGVEVWPWYRRLISWGATLLARPVTKVKDPMSGLFFLDKHVIENLNLGTQGYKIGLEIFVKGRYQTFKEIPYIFRNREHGKSKLGTKIYWHYLKDLWSLYQYKFFHSPA